MESLQESSALPPLWVIVTKQHFPVFLCYSCYTARKETHFVHICSYLMDPCYVKRLWARWNFQSYFSSFLDNVFSYNPIFHYLWLCDLGYCSQFDLKEEMTKARYMRLSQRIDIWSKTLQWNLLLSYKTYFLGKISLTHWSKHSKISTLCTRTNHYWPVLPNMLQSLFLQWKLWVSYLPTGIFMWNYTFCNIL